MIRASRNVRKNPIWALKCPYVAQTHLAGNISETLASIPFLPTSQGGSNSKKRHSQLPRHAPGHASPIDTDARRRPDTDRRRDRLCHLATPLRRTRRRRSAREPPPVLRAFVNEHPVPGQDPRRRARATGGAQSHVRRRTRPIQELASRPAPFLLQTRARVCARVCSSL